VNNAASSRPIFSSLGPGANIDKLASLSANLCLDQREAIMQRKLQFSIIAQYSMSQ
jgi:hypothetical protein